MHECRCVSKTVSSKRKNIGTKWYGDKRVYLPSDLVGVQLYNNDIGGVNLLDHIVFL